MSLFTLKLVTRFVTYLFHRHDAEDPQLPSQRGCVSARSRVEQRGRTGGGNPAGLFFYVRTTPPYANMTPLIAITGIAGLVWAIVLFRYGDLVAGCLAVLLVGSVFGHAFFHLSIIGTDDT